MPPSGAPYSYIMVFIILVPRGRAPFGQHQKSRPLARSNTGSPRFTDFPSLCACSELSLTNVIGSGLNLLCLQSHSKPECRWTGPEVVIFGADQKERGLWGREWVFMASGIARGRMRTTTLNESRMMAALLTFLPFCRGGGGGGGGGLPLDPRSPRSIVRDVGRISRLLEHLERIYGRFFRVNGDVKEVIL